MVDPRGIEPHVFPMFSTGWGFLVMFLVRTMIEDILEIGVDLIVYQGALSAEGVLINGLHDGRRLPSAALHRVLFRDVQLQHHGGVQVPERMERDIKTCFVHQLTEMVVYIVMVVRDDVFMRMVRLFDQALQVCRQPVPPEPGIGLRRLLQRGHAVHVDDHAVDRDHVAVDVPILRLSAPAPCTVPLSCAACSPPVVYVVACISANI